MGKKDNFESKETLKMKYVAAYCLLALAGKENIGEADIKNFFKKANVSDIDDDCIKAVVSSFKGKQLHEVINSGFGKISSLSVGGGSGSGATGGNATETKADAPKEEEKKKEEEEEEEASVGFDDLFG